MSSISQSATRVVNLAQRGFTLIEVMVSLTLGLVVLAGVMAMFTISRDTFNIAESGLGFQPGYEPLNLTSNPPSSRPLLMW